MSTIKNPFVSTLGGVTRSLFGYLVPMLQDKRPKEEEEEEEGIRPESNRPNKGAIKRGSLAAGDGVGPEGGAARARKAMRGGLGFQRASHALRAPS